MSVNQFQGGTHYHTYNFSQRELDLETKVPCTFRAAPKLKKFIEQKAQAAGIPTSKYIENELIKHFRSEDKIKELYAILDNIIGKNF